jgi:hypothetical protein
MKIGGWKTRSIFERYAIVSHTDIEDALQKLEQRKKLSTLKSDRIQNPSEIGKPRLVLCHRGEFDLAHGPPLRKYYYMVMAH